MSHLILEVDSNMELSEIKTIYLSGNMDQKDLIEELEISIQGSSWLRDNRPPAILANGTHSFFALMNETGFGPSPAHYKWKETVIDILDKSSTPQDWDLYQMCGPNFDPCLNNYLSTFVYLDNNWRMACTMYKDSPPKLHSDFPVHLMTQAPLEAIGRFKNLNRI